MTDILEPIYFRLNGMTWQHHQGRTNQLESQPDWMLIRRLTPANLNHFAPIAAGIRRFPAGSIFRIDGPFNFTVGEVWDGQALGTTLLFNVSSLTDEHFPLSQRALIQAMVTGPRNTRGVIRDFNIGLCHPQSDRDFEAAYQTGMRLEAQAAQSILDAMVIPPIDPEKMN